MVLKLYFFEQNILHCFQPARMDLGDFTDIDGPHNASFFEFEQGEYNLLVIQRSLLYFTAPSCYLQTIVGFKIDCYTPR